MSESDEELKDEIESLKKQLSVMEGMMENLMNMHRNVLEKLSMNSDVEQRYLRMLSVYQRFGKVSPSALPGIDDQISECIVEILLDANSLNITQITERMREKRGSASRHTVRDRLQKLEKKGIVTMDENENMGKGYSLTQSTTDDWAELLGIKK